MYKMKKSKKHMHINRMFLSALCAFILVFSIFAVTAAAEEPAKNKTVKVGYRILENFQEEETVMLNGKKTTIRSGYGYDYLQMIRNYTGWEYTYTTSSWDFLLHELEAGNIDIMSHIAKTPLREEKLLFSAEPQGYETHYLYVDGTNKTIKSGDYSAINGMKIGVLRGDFRTEVFLNWCAMNALTVEIQEYNKAKDLYAALRLGKVQAVSSASSLTAAASYEEKCRAIVRFEDIPVYFAVKPGPEGEALLEELNAAHSAILDINKNFGADIQKKYNQTSHIEAPRLTESEIAILAKYGTLKVGYCDNRRPLAYTKNDELAGLLADYLAKMTEEYGILFETKPYETGTELLSALQNHEVDIISPIGYTYGIAEASHILITNPITVETMVAVYKGSSSKNIFENIAVLDNSVTEKDYLNRYYPDSNSVKATTIGEAIDLVANGNAGCYIIRSSTWSWYKNDYPSLSDLQVLPLPNSNEVNMAIHENSAELLPILNKGISLLSDADINSSIVAHSDATDTVNWLTVIKKNPIAFTASILGLIFFL